LSHKNVIRLIQVIRNEKQLEFVFEYMETTLDQLLYHKNYQFDEKAIKHIVSQILLGLQHCHSKGYVHRDLKGDNILINTSDLEVKICDFGIALHEKEIDVHEQYFCTRYYRSPELLLNLKYSQATDVWAAGVIMTELYLREPLFSGENDQDMLFLISQVIEVPGEISKMFQPTEKTSLKKLLPTASVEAIDLLEKILKWDPNKRFTCTHALNHAFFANLGGNKTYQ
jgi:protein kinase